MWFLFMGKTNCVSNVPSVGLYNTRTGEIETDRMDGWSSAAVVHKTYSFSKGFPCFWTSIVRTLQQISANEKKTRLRKGQLFWGRNIFLQKAIMSFHSIVKCLSVPQNWSLNPIRHIQGLKRVCLCFTAPFPISKLLLLPSSYAHIKINFLIKLCIQGVPKQKKILTKIECVGAMGTTWECLIQLSLIKKRPKNNFRHKRFNFSSNCVIRNVYIHNPQSRCPFWASIFLSCQY